jgi:hypothetical protein
MLDSENLDITRAIAAAGRRTNDHSTLTELEHIAKAAARDLGLEGVEFSIFVLDACPWLW